MIRESGEVVRNDQGFIWVRTIRQSTCGSCHSRNGCGQKLLNQYTANAADIRAKLGVGINPELIKPGDQVEIGIAESAVVLSSMLTYGFPIAATMLAVAASASLKSDLITACSAFAALLMGALFVRWCSPKLGISQLFEPVVLGLKVTEKTTQIKM